MKIYLYRANIYTFVAIFIALLLKVLRICILSRYMANGMFLSFQFELPDRVSFLKFEKQSKNHVTNTKQHKVLLNLNTDFDTEGYNCITLSLYVS